MFIYVYSTEHTNTHWMMIENSNGIISSRSIAMERKLRHKRTRKITNESVMNKHMAFEWYRIAYCFNRIFYLDYNCTPMLSVQCFSFIRDFFLQNMKPFNFWLKKERIKYGEWIWMDWNVWYYYMLYAMYIMAAFVLIQNCYSKWNYSNSKLQPSTYANTQKTYEMISLFWYFSCWTFHFSIFLFYYFEYFMHT